MSDKVIAAIKDREKATREANKERVRDQRAAEKAAAAEDKELTAAAKEAEKAES